MLLDVFGRDDETRDETEPPEYRSPGIAHDMVSGDEQRKLARWLFGNFSPPEQHCVLRLGSTKIGRIRAGLLGTPPLRQGHLMD